MANNNQPFKGCCPIFAVPKPPKPSCFCPPRPRGPKNPRKTITLTVNQTTVCTSDQGNNTAFLSGQVFPAMPGVVVSFSVSNTALGTLIPSATITNASGNFTAVFISTNGPGSVAVTATLPDSPGTFASVAITIVDCRQPTATISSFTANPLTVCTSSTGSPSSSLTGEVLMNGNPAGGVAVNFSVSNPSLGTVSPFSTTTDAAGHFNAMFTANNIPGSETVTASLPAFPGTTANVPITIVDCRPPTAVITNFTANPSTVCTSSTGVPTSSLTGQVLVNGNPAGGVAVNFSVSNPSLGTVSPFSTTTDAAGHFNAMFTANNIPGSETVTASLPAFPGTTANVPITIVNCGG